VVSERAVSKHIANVFPQLRCLPPRTTTVAR
jgi:hypothetical protein